MQTTEVSGVVVNALSILILRSSETSTRPSFRSTLSQPSQMGNFKHQSLRDRDRDRDGDKDRERNIRDKEGQERLRDVSADEYLLL